MTLATIDRKLNRLIEEVKMLKEDALISEDEAARLLNCSKKWLQQLVSKGVITAEDYKINKAGKRTYLKHRLIKDE